MDPLVKGAYVDWYSGKGYVDVKTHIGYPSDAKTIPLFLSPAHLSIRHLGRFPSWMLVWCRKEPFKANEGRRKDDSN